MDTDLIFQFRSVIESGTIAKAAEISHMTPGAMSRAMKRLESDLGVALFTPSGRNIVPTSAAHSFYRSSDEIIRSIQASRYRLQVNNFELKRITSISTFEVFSTHFLASAIADGIIQGPIKLLEKIPGEIEESILNGSSDYGITYVPHLHPGLEHGRAGELTFGVYVTTNKKDSDLPFAVPITGLGTNIIQAKSLDGWPSNIPRKIEYRFETLETALDLATRGRCRICCPKFIVGLENERLKVSYLLVEEKQKFKLPKLKVYIVRRKSDPESVVFRSLARSVRSLLAKAVK